MSNFFLRSRSLPGSLFKGFAASLSLATIFTLCFITSPAAAVGPEFEVELLADGLSVTGATVEGEVQIFGLWRQRHGTWSEVGQVLDRVVDDDGDGAITWSLGKDVPTASALFAVDLATGAWDVVVPPGFPVRIMPVPDVQILTDGSSFTIASDAAELLVVRPGYGVWSLRASDGGSSDSSAIQDGTLAVLVNQLQPDENEPSLAPTQAFAGGDLLFGIDRNSLEVFVEEIAGDEK